MQKPKEYAFFFKDDIFEENPGALRIKQILKKTTLNTFINNSRFVSLT